MAEERPLASITGATLIIGVIWNQSWILIGRTEAETPILWPPDVKNWLVWKGPDSGKDWRQKEKETTENEMVGWHHWLKGHKFEQALAVCEGQESLVCWSAWGRKESDTTEWLNWMIERNGVVSDNFYLKNSCKIWIVNVFKVLIVEHNMEII